MGRRRKDDSQGLPPRVYLRRGTFFYAHRSGKWENLGKDLSAAKRKAEHYADPTGTYGTMTWWLQQFLLDFEQQVRAKLKSERTLEDYQGAIGTADEPGPLRAFFGAMLPAQIEPRHVTAFLEVGAKAGRAVRANRERACLSSCISWMLRNGHGGITVNVCMRASGVQRNTETARDRYVTDAEYRAVYAAAPAQVRLLMELAYRTLQRPDSDILHWTAAVVKAAPEGQKVLAFQQHKTKRSVQIALTGELGTLVAKAVGEVPVLHHRPGPAQQRHAQVGQQGVAAHLQLGAGDGPPPGAVLVGDLAALHGHDLGAPAAGPQVQGEGVGHVAAVVGQPGQQLGQLGLGQLALHRAGLLAAAHGAPAGQLAAQHQAPPVGHVRRQAAGVERAVPHGAQRLPQHAGHHGLGALAVDQVEGIGAGDAGGGPAGQVAQLGAQQAVGLGPGLVGDVGLVLGQPLVTRPAHGVGVGLGGGHRGGLALALLGRWVAAGVAGGLHVVPGRQRGRVAQRRPGAQLQLPHAPVDGAAVPVHPRQPAGTGHQAQAGGVVEGEMIPRGQRPGGTRIEHFAETYAAWKATPEVTLVC